jgi:hypothetical protein
MTISGCPLRRVTRECHTASGVTLSGCQFRTVTRNRRWCRANGSAVPLFVPLSPAVPLAASLVSFSCQRLARRAARFIVCWFLLPTTCPLCRLRHRSFLSRTRRAAHRIVRFFLLSMLCPQCHSLNCSFLSVGDVLSAAPLAVSVVLLSMSGARLIARFFHPSTCCRGCR